MFVEYSVFYLCINVKTVHWIYLVLFIYYDFYRRKSSWFLVSVVNITRSNIYYYSNNIIHYLLLHCTCLYLFYFWKKKIHVYIFGRGNGIRTESDNKDNRRWRTGFYFRSPWASIALLVSGTSMINVKICLRKWASVIRTEQSLSLSLSFPGLASREIRPEMHYTSKERKANFSFP